MRIGVDCRSLQEPHPSGVSIYTQEVLRGLISSERARGHTFVLFLSGHELKKKSGLLREVKARIAVDSPRAKVEWRVSYWPNKIFTALALVNSAPSIKRIFGQVDAVFIPNMQFFPLQDQAVPMVLTIHDLSFERYPECLDFKGRWRHRLLHPRVFVGRSQVVIAVSEHTKQEMGFLYGAVEEKIDVIYPGLSKLPEANIEKLQKFGLPEKYILSLSAVEPRKNIQALLRAMELVRKQIPDLELVIAGGAAWRSKKIVQQIQEQPGVRYLGYVDEPTKVALLQQAQIFVYPSLYEGFGFPPLEAQQAGTPVVVGANSSLPEVLGNSAMYVDVLDCNSVSEGIINLYKDQAMRTEYIEKGRQNCKRFSWDKTAQQILTTFISLQQ